MNMRAGLCPFLSAYDQNSKPESSLLKYVGSGFDLMMFESTATLLNDKQTLIVTGCCAALGEIGRNGPLALPYDVCGDENKANKSGARAAARGGSGSGSKKNDVDDDRSAFDPSKTQKGVVDKLMEITGNAKLPIKVSHCRKAA